MRYAQIIYNKVISLFESDLPSLSDYTDPMDCIKDLWQIYNEQYFDNKLDLPAFRWKKNTQSLRTLADFSYKYHRSQGTTLDHTLSFSKKLLRNEELLRSTLLHEMCHQAVVEIDNSLDDHHGPLWKRWARSCGISDSATTKADIPKTYSEEERERVKREENKNDLTEVEEIMKDREKLSNLENGMFVTYPTRDNGTVVGRVGLIGKAPKTGKYATVFSRNQNNLYSAKVNKNFVYSVKPSELSILQSRFSPELISDIIEYANEKSSLGRYTLSQKIMRQLQEGLSRTSRLTSNINRLLEHSF